MSLFYFNFKPINRRYIPFAVFTIEGIQYANNNIFKSFATNPNTKGIPLLNTSNTTTSKNRGALKLNIKITVAKKDKKTFLLNIRQHTFLTPDNI